MHASGVFFLQIADNICHYLAICLMYLSDIWSNECIIVIETKSREISIELNSVLYLLIKRLLSCHTLHSLHSEHVAFTCCVS